MADLTAKQVLFVKEYLVDLNATAAYKRAGYAGSGNGAEVNASKLLRHAKVAAAIQAAMNKRADKVEVSADYVLRTIKETIERCRQAEPVFDRKGDRVYVRANNDDDAPLVPAFTFDAGGVLKGAELLGKHLKLFTDKTEHSGPNGGPMIFTKLERSVVFPKK